MNERIKELIKQSYVWVKFPETLYKADDDVEGFLDFDREKFVELILQDIDKIIDDLYHVMPLEQANVLLTLDENIKAHFYGVE